jgi:hypothetical protein
LGAITVSFYIKIQEDNYAPERFPDAIILEVFIH